MSIGHACMLQTKANRWLYWQLSIRLENTWHTSHFRLRLPGGAQEWLLSRLRLSKSDILFMVVIEIHTYNINRIRLSSMGR